MPKPITDIFDPDRPKKRKKKKSKQKTDYTEYLQPPQIPENQCPHTRKPQEASGCSQCLSAKPSIIHKPSTQDWWMLDDLVDEDLIDPAIDIDSILDDE